MAQHDARTPVNASQAASEHRVRHARLFDEEIRPHNERFRAAARVGPRDRVLDVGCGTGQSTREAAHAARSGSALGVDLSAPALEHARRLSDQEGLRNVSYQLADAQVHQFPPEHFDIGISRFGVMFFADPVAAFSNIGRALRPGARLVVMVWQDRGRNEWTSAIGQSLTTGTTAPASPGPPAAAAPRARCPDPFSLGDPATAESILAASGFDEVAFTDVHEPVYYGADRSIAFDFVLGLRITQDVLAGLDGPAAERALDRLRATLAEHDTGRGVFFDSRAWIITARRR
jgi:ubiquinone/menaquinone biosynthesis C-methylase UbiE